MASEYVIKELYEKTWSILDKGFCNENSAVYMYLLEGSQKALLIDSGYGGLDLKRILSGITDKEIINVSTHGHIAHAMGAFRFEEAYIHSSDIFLYNELRKPVSFRNLAFGGFVRAADADKLKGSEFSGLDEEMALHPGKDLQPIDNIEGFELGNRLITWKRFSGHTMGSIVLCDEKNNTFFNGDAASVFNWLFLPESASLKVFRDNLTDYIETLNILESPQIYFGHSDMPEGLELFESLLKLTETVLDGTAVSHPVVLPQGRASIVSKNGISIYYDKEKII